MLTIQDNKANKYSTLHSPIITKLLKTGFQPNCGATGYGDETQYSKLSCYSAHSHIALFLTRTK